ncbi:DNA integrity scanning protein DisA nucleotide-binding domain protein [symbiont of Argiope bruennichi]|uniref:diadenylate cyclase n=1 Tax=symbiont of Argiope bruennichi TaxID=2810479 RepID=UPI003DA45C2A
MTITLLTLILICELIILTILSYKKFTLLPFFKFNYKELLIPKIKQTTNILCDSLKELSQSNTGALFVIEKNTSLKKIINSANVINADINLNLILSIFQKRSLLHDGAVIISDNKIACTCAYLPTSQQKLKIVLGSRHRAGLGISEKFDSLSIIVSEQTGAISFAQAGILEVINDPNIIYEKILDFLSK